MKPLNHNKIVTLKGKVAMSNGENNNLLTEYQVINNWRNSVVNSDFIMTSIFIPLSIATFFSYYLIKNSKDTPQLLFWGASSFLILTWRWYAHHIDASVLKIYPKIVQLEILLELTFTREYLKNIRTWWTDKQLDNESWLPDYLEVKYRVEHLCKTQKYFSRGHGKLNFIAFLVIVSEFLIICLVN